MLPATLDTAAFAAMARVSSRVSMRGLQVRPGMIIAIEREYEATGQLSEVRSRTAVRGGWVGGRM